MSTTTPGSKLIKFLGSLLGTGGVDRTLHDKLAETISVKDFGAKVDGVTDDSNAVIKAASVSNRIQIPSGFCVVNSTVLSTYADYFTGSGMLVVAGSGIPAGEIHNNVTLNVPSQFPTIQAACNYLRTRFISSTVSVTIKVADGTYSWSNIEPAIPNGDRVSIIGNTTTPANCVINVNNSNNASGFVFYRGSRIYLVDGFTINGTFGWQSHGIWASQSYGAGFAGKDGGAGCQIGSNVRINKMYYGVLADCGATFTAPNGGVIINEAGDCGTLARWGGAIDFQNCTATNVADTTVVGNTLGFGFMAEVGGTGHYDNSTASGCAVAGVCSQNGASVWAHGFTSTNNSFGAYSNENASMEATNLVATGGTVGAVADNGGYLMIQGATISGCSGSGINADHNGTIRTVSGATVNNCANGSTNFNGGRVQGPVTGSGNTFALQVPPSGVSVIAQSGSGGSLSGTTATTTYVTISVPANSLSANGSLRITTLWSCDNNANAKTITISYGGTTFSSFNVANSLSAHLLTVVRNRSATNQVASSSGLSSYGTSTSVISTGTVNTAATQNILIQGTLAVGTDFLNLEAYTVEVINP